MRRRKTTTTSIKRTSMRTVRVGVVRPTWHDAPCPTGTVYVLRPAWSVQGDPEYIVKKKSVSQYIGATTCIERRIRQHNGILCGGAKRTQRARAGSVECGVSGRWVVVLTITGFRSFREALQFEFSVRLATRRASRNARAAAEQLVRTKKWDSVSLIVTDVLRSNLSAQRPVLSTPAPPPPPPPPR